MGIVRRIQPSTLTAYSQFILVKHNKLHGDLLFPVSSCVTVWGMAERKMVKRQDAKWKGYTVCLGGHAFEFV